MLLPKNSTLAVILSKFWTLREAPARLAEYFKHCTILPNVSTVAPSTQLQLRKDERTRWRSFYCGRMREHVELKETFSKERGTCSSKFMVQSGLCGWWKMKLQLAHEDTFSALCFFPLSFSISFFLSFFSETLISLRQICSSVDFRKKCKSSSPVLDFLQRVGFPEICV